MHRYFGVFIDLMGSKHQCFALIIDILFFLINTVIYLEEGPHFVCRRNIFQSVKSLMNLPKILDRNGQLFLLLLIQCLLKHLLGDLFFVLKEFWKAGLFKLTQSFLHFLHFCAWSRILKFKENWFGSKLFLLRAKFIDAIINLYNAVNFLKIWSLIFAFGFMLL